MTIGDRNYIELRNLLIQPFIFTGVDSTFVIRISMKGKKSRLLQKRIKFFFLQRHSS